jgi:hypothetical protein
MKAMMRIEQLTIDELHINRHVADVPLAESHKTKRAVAVRESGNAFGRQQRCARAPHDDLCTIHPLVRTDSHVIDAPRELHAVGAIEIDYSDPDRHALNPRAWQLNKLPRCSGFKRND